MTREELIKEIAKRIKDIRNLYYSIYPEGDFLDLTITKGFIDFHNRYYEEDKNYSIDYYENEIFIRMNGEYKNK